MLLIIVNVLLFKLFSAVIQISRIALRSPKTNFGCALTLPATSVRTMKEISKFTRAFIVCLLKTRCIYAVNKTIQYNVNIENVKKKLFTLPEELKRECAGGGLQDRSPYRYTHTHNLFWCEYDCTMELHITNDASAINAKQLISWLWGKKYKKTIVGSRPRREWKKKMATRVRRLDRHARTKPIRPIRYLYRNHFFLFFSMAISLLL